MMETETYTPETLEEVGALLLAADGEPRPLARGTSLIARSQGESAPIVVALTHVPELNRLDYEERDGLLIGAALPWAASWSFCRSETPMPSWPMGAGRPDRVRSGRARPSRNFWGTGRRRRISWFPSSVLGRRSRSLDPTAGRRWRSRPSA